MTNKLFSSAQDALAGLVADGQTLTVGSFGLGQLRATRQIKKMISI